MKLTTRKRDFDTIKSAWNTYCNSNRFEIEDCYKTGGSEEKKRTYFEHKYHARRSLGGYDFRIVNAAIHTYTFGFRFMGDDGEFSSENTREIFCYVLPTRKLFEYVDELKK